MAGAAAELRESLATFLGSVGEVVEFPDLLQYNMELGRLLLESPDEFFRIVSEVRDGKGLRVRNLPQTLTPKRIRAEHVGKFIQVEGIVTRATEIRPEISVAAYRCKWCGHVQMMPQDGYELIPPVWCENPNCTRRNGPFSLEEGLSEWSDWQGMRIQERPERLRGGEMPSQLDVVARGDLCGRVVPGDHVVLVGILDAVRKNGRERVFRPVLRLNHVEVLSKSSEELELTEEDVDWIERTIREPDYQERLVRSIAPEIHGYEAVKEAILLQLFGSDPVVLEDGTRLRGDIHILLVGDPSTSKSTLLEWAARVGFRGIYVSGKKSTGVGLTASAVRDELTGAWTLEAGAVVLADGGLVAADEFEKIAPEDRAALLQAMEQQKVSVAKAGIVATLNARTSILAAANPKGGRWDPQRNLTEQIALEPPLLSRFDLIFILRDTPDVGKDMAIANHILSVRANRRAEAPFSPEQLRKIVCHLRRKIHPDLPEEQRRRIAEFYVKWRRSTGEDTPAVTPRQLESLIRLSLASARMRGSPVVEEQDVQRAVRLISMFLEEAGIDVNTGKVDIDVILTGKPKSVRSRLQVLMQLVEEMEEEEGEVEVRKLVERAEQMGIAKEDVYSFVEEERNRGFLYEVREGVVKRVVR
jgi:replicative DNA helicase Mcm